MRGLPRISPLFMNRREFQFSEGSSNKFWSIELRELSFIVHYGRVGTHGQSQEKTFGTADAAKKEHDKLIAEKTKKGYAEVNVGEVSKSRPVPVQKHADEEKKPKEKVHEKEDAPVSETCAVAAEPPPATSATAPLAAAAPVALTMKRRVRIKPEDRALVSWLWQGPLTPPPLPAFNDELCTKKALKWLTSYGYVITHSVELPSRMTREEAWFWLCARNAAGEYSSKGWYNKQGEASENWERMLRKATQDQPPPISLAGNKTIQDALFEVCRNPAWMSALVPFFTPIDLADRLIDTAVSQTLQAAHSYQQHPNYGLASEFARLVLIYEGNDVREKFREVMVARFRQDKNPQGLAAQLALTFLSAVRGGAELQQSLLTAPASPGSNAHDLSSHNLFTLGGCADEETFVEEAKRLGLQLPTPGGYYTDRSERLFLHWLAATEWRHLGWLTKAVCQGTAKDETATFARILALVEAPEAAPAMLEVQLNSKAPFVAAEWFVANPLLTAVGLAPVAMTSGKAAEAARDILHQLRRKGQLDVLVAALAHLPDNARDWLKSEVIDHSEELLADLQPEEVPALYALLSAIKPLKASAWLQPSNLPPIKILGKKLPLADVDRVLSALKDSPLAADAAPAPLIPLLKQHADATSLDAFAWKLFEQWLSMGATSKDKWALGALGHLGGDASVLKLTPLVRDWPGESQHQRAVFGLEVLRAIGTDTALMSLNGIAQKLKFQGLKEKAKVMMEGIAQARGLSREQLADRIVPDCGLDEKGSRVFDFGPRQFKFVLGPELKPLVRDAAGKLKPNLPDPNKTDDTEKAEAAVNEWKLLKKTLKEVLKIQAERLEDAMITGRRWTPAEFELLIIKHPLVVNLARQLVFGSYTEQGALTHSFRITEDQSLADANDDPCDLPGGSIGVVHPAHLDEAAKSAWGQVLSDYEIIPPFQQLGREICRAEPEDLGQTQITRFKGPKIPGIVVYGMLERSHWVKDTPADAGGFMQHSKHFPAANLTAFIQYTGMGIGYYEEPQEIESVYFVPGHIKPDWWGNHDNKMKIESVDAVVLSEVLRLVRAIVAKAE